MRELSADEIMDLSADELEREVERHDRLYWEENDPEITDESFDRLVERLRQLRPSSEVLDAIGGQRDVDPDAVPESEATDETGQKVAHRVPMLSLEKCYTETELRKWFDKIGCDAIASPKVDGVAMSLRYDDDGRLELAATRGTGRVGEVVTRNARHVHGVQTEGVDAGIEVRGEAYMPKAVFEDRFAEEFANPRNLAAGALKLKDASKTADYDLRFAAYDILGIDASLDTEERKFEQLEKLGFEHVEVRRVSADDAQDTFEEIQSRADDLPFEIDGVVFKANELAVQGELGATSHHPRYSIAYKIQGESGFSTLCDVEWNVSRTGAINPVALIEPVTLSGATVSRVSLHNLRIMEMLGGGELPKLGAKLLVTRRGGVIPYVEEIAVPGDEPVQLPDECPSCGAPTYRKEDVLTAEHEPSCVAASYRQLLHFISVLGADGFGDKLVRQLVEEGIVERYVDFFRLEIDELLPLERMGEKRATNLLASVESCRETRFATFVHALGLNEVGERIARELESGFDSLDALLEADPDGLMELEGIGPILAENIVTGLEELADEIDELRSEVTLTWPAPADDDEGPLSGVSYLFTGELESMRRKEAQERVQALGGETPSGVSKSLDFLVIGDADHKRFEEGWRTTKLKRAEALIEGGASLQIINESTFLDHLERD